MIPSDPIVGQTRTKVGESYTQSSSRNDPVVGQTRTKVGESYVKTNNYTTGYFNSTPYYNRPHYYPTRRYATHTFTSSINALFWGFAALAIITTLVSTISKVSHFSTYGGNYYRDYGSGYSGYHSGYNSWFGGQTQICDKIQYCDLHQSGGTSNCRINLENCRWI